MANAGPSSYSFSTVGHSRINMGWVTEILRLYGGWNFPICSPLSALCLFRGKRENPAAFEPRCGRRCDKRDAAAVDLVDVVQWLRWPWLLCLPSEKQVVARRGLIP